MATVSERLIRPDGTPHAGRRITAELVIPAWLDGDAVSGGQQARLVATTDEDGVWTLDLAPNADITPEGTHYRLRRGPGHGDLDVQVITDGVVGSEAVPILDTTTPPDPSALAVEVQARIAADEELQAQIDAGIDPTGLADGDYFVRVSDGDAELVPTTGMLPFLLA